MTFVPVVRSPFKQVIRSPFARVSGGAAAVPPLVSSALTFEAMTNLTDEGSGVYAATAAGTSNTASGKVNGILDPNTDGWIEALYPATGDAAFMIAFSSSNSSTLAYSSSQNLYILSVNTAGALSTGAPSAASLTASGFTLTAGVGVGIRLRRASGVVTAETTTDNWATFTVRVTLGSGSTSVLYGRMYSTYSVTPRRIYTPKAANFIFGTPNSMQGQWVVPNVTQVGSAIYVGSAGTGGEERATRISGGIGTTASLATYEVDDHNVPAIIELASGKMLAVYARHSLVATVYNHISTSVNAADWGVQRTFTTSDTATYLQAHRATGQTRVFAFYRVGDSNDGNWAARWTDDEGTTWSAADVVFAPNTYITTVLAEDGFTLRCYAYDHPISVSAVNHNIYLFYINLLTGAITDSAGTALANLTAGTGLPLTRAQQHMIVEVTDPTTTRLYESAKTGTPSILASEFIDADSSVYYRYTYSTTTGLFTRSAVCTSGPAFFGSTSCYFGGVCFGTSLDEVYVSRNLGASVGLGSWELSRWTHSAGVWTQQAVIRRSANIIARPQVKADRLWWSEVSSYIAYTNFQAVLHSVAL